jgi:hypothetical protein
MIRVKGSGTLLVACTMALHAEAMQMQLHAQRMYTYILTNGRSKQTSDVLACHCWRSTRLLVCSVGRMSV